jgi:NAD-dependent SIR2 family protein deacetylase
MQNQARVFFLGAGASADAGIPMASQLLTKIRETDPYERRYYKFYTVPSEQSFLKIAIEAVLQNQEWVRTGDLNTFNIERLLSIGEMAARLGMGIPYSGGQLVKAQWFVDALMSWVLEIIEQSKKAELPRCYQLFCDQLTPSDSLVTLNYDLVCEAYLKDGGKRPEYHLSSSAGQGSSACLESAIDLLKLHGSINWRRCVSTSKKKSCANVSVHQDGDIPVAGYGCARSCDCGHGVLRSFVVAPTPLKDHEDSELMRIWKWATKKLLSAAEIYIIGYSMPSYDISVRNLLGLVSLNNKKAKFYVVNPDDKCSGAFAFLPRERLEPVQNDFQSFVTNVLVG